MRSASSAPYSAPVKTADGKSGLRASPRSTPSPTTTTCRSSRPRQHGQPFDVLLRRQPADETDDRLAVRVTTRAQGFVAGRRHEAGDVDAAAPAVHPRDAVCGQVLHRRGRRRQRAVGLAVQPAGPRPGRARQSRRRRSSRRSRPRRSGTPRPSARRDSGPRARRPTRAAPATPDAPRRGRSRAAR